MKSHLAALCGMVLLLGCVNTSKSNRPLTVLLDAPEFTLQNVKGGELKSEDLKGKVVVVDFWATWCVPCLAEIPHYNEMRERLKDQGVEFVGVTFDSPSKGILPKVTEMKMLYPVVLGTDAVDAAFGGHPGYPTTFLIGKDWKVYRKILGVHANKAEMLEKDIKDLLEKS